MNNFRRQNDEIASSACLKTDHFPTQSTTCCYNARIAPLYAVLVYAVCVVCCAAVFCVLRRYILCEIRHYMPCYIYCATRKQVVASARKSDRNCAAVYRKSRLRAKKNRGRCTLALPPPKTLRFSSIFNSIFHISNCQ